MLLSGHGLFDFVARTNFTIIAIVATIITASSTKVEMTVTTTIVVTFVSPMLPPAEPFMTIKAYVGR